MPSCSERDPALGDVQKRKIDVIHSSGTHLLTLINDTLEMSKIEAGRSSLNLEPFDLYVLLNDVQWMFRELTENKGLEFTFELDRDLPRALSGDAGKIRQVLINLLSNAVKFTNHGRVAVRASSRVAAEGRTSSRSRSKTRERGSSSGISRGSSTHSIRRRPASASVARDWVWPSAGTSRG